MKKITKKDKPVEVFEVPKLTIQPLPLDFGREDLNLIAQKVNELIELSKQRS